MEMKRNFKLRPQHVPYLGKTPHARTVLMNYGETRTWGKQFKEFHYYEIQWLSMIERGFRLGEALLNAALRKQRAARAHGFPTLLLSLCDHVHGKVVNQVSPHVEM